jgi:hypothetical protein
MPSAKDGGKSHCKLQGVWFVQIILSAFQYLIGWGLTKFGYQRKL